ncbi:MAG: lipase [Oscillospiraceae bacterium]|nr:lipase [Oscillospiraceae bacterium]
MKILCFGDSNTYGYDPRSYLGERYPLECRWTDILVEKLGYTVINLGENGREIPRRAVEFAPADLLIIMLGTNDLLQGNSPKAVRERMANFLEQLAFDKSRILLVTPPPMKLGAWVPSPALADASKALNYQDLGVRCVGPWDLPLCFDGVHLTEEGHKILAERIHEAIK